MPFYIKIIVVSYTLLFLSCLLYPFCLANTKPSSQLLCQTVKAFFSTFFSIDFVSRSFEFCLLFFLIRSVKSETSYGFENIISFFYSNHMHYFACKVGSTDLFFIFLNTYQRHHYYYNKVYITSTMLCLQYLQSKTIENCRCPRYCIHNIISTKLLF